MIVHKHMFEHHEQVLEDCYNALDAVRKSTAGPEYQRISSIINEVIRRSGAIVSSVIWC